MKSRKCKENYHRMWRALIKGFVYCAEWIFNKQMNFYSHSNEQAAPKKLIFIGVVENSSHKVVWRGLGKWKTANTFIKWIK